jgi:hypothetical protein
MAAIPNPRYPGSPARMADGRLFTNYRPNCSLLAPLGSGPWSDWSRKQNMVNTGEVTIATDRSTTVMRAGSVGCVDTMVPEFSKRVYAWNGPATSGLGMQGPAELVSQPVGLGTGRMYLPGHPGLVAGDPDVLARATIPDSMLPGTFSPNPNAYMMGGVQAPSVARETVGNRNTYSAPYGN